MLVSKPCRLGIRVVIVVPALTHREQTESRKIVSLHGMASNVPAPHAVVVGKESNEPVPGQREDDAAADPGRDKGPSSDHIENGGERKLLSHPGSLKEP